MSLATNLISLLVLLVGCIEFAGNEYFFAAGAFALSGAMTNWLAVHMLFEKIPFLYGSGVVELKFEQFKVGIRHLVVTEFFNDTVLAKQLGPGDEQLDGMFERLVQVIQESSFGNMLNMIGGQEALQPLRQPFIKAVREYLAGSSEGFKDKVLKLVDQRLDELTPSQVKKIVEDMIRTQLGWLVVWGGIFGGIIGLVFEMLG